MLGTYLTAGLTMSLVSFSDCEKSKSVPKNVFQEIQLLEVILDPRWRFPQQPSLGRPLCLKMG